LFSSSYVIRLMEDEMGKAYSAYRVLVGKSKGRGPHEIPDVNGKIILEWALKEWDGMG